MSLNTTSIPTIGGKPRPARLRSPLQLAIAKVAKRPSVIVALVWLVIIVIATSASPLLAPYSPLHQDLSAGFALPSGSHLLGADSLGRDILSRLMFGGSGGLLGALEATVIAVVLGVPAGLFAGYLGGWLDQATNFVINVIFATPGFIVLLTVAFVTGNSIPWIMGALGVIFSGGIARLVRASTLSARDLLYVDAARVSGLSNRRVVLRHVLPNVAGPLLVQTFLVFSTAFIIVTSLSFLGLGFSPIQPSWGQMVFEATQNVSTHPWLMVPIGGLLIFTVLSLNHLGSSIRDALPQAQRESLLVSTRPRRTVPTPANNVSSLAENNPAITSAEHPEILRVDNMSVSFPSDSGEVVIVDKVNFVLHPGEVLGLVGESGCGKTMTALAVVGLVPTPGAVTADSLWIDGKDVAEWGEKQRATLRGSTVGLVSQEPMVALDPSFTVASTLTEALRTHRKMTRKEAYTEAVELLRKVGIPRAEIVAKRFPHELSGGMAQRVAIALALTGEPKILVADEPTTALDVTVQAEIIDLLLSIRDTLGTAIVLVSHDLGVVADICDRVAVMYAGQVIETGTTEEVLTNPTHPYTRGLIGASPEIGEVKEALKTIPGRVPVPAMWPVGCRFAERCPLATDACRSESIPLVSVGVEQLSRCIRTEVARTAEILEAAS